MLGEHSVRRPLAKLADRPGLVDGGIEIAVVQLEEDPLRPFVIARVGGGEAAPPVVAEPDRLELADHVGDVALGGDTGMDAVLDSELLSGQAECVEAHGMQHVEPAHPLVPAEDVRGDVAQWVPDVQADA